MQRIAAALGLVAGSVLGACYAPSFTDCALRCSSASKCPDGLRCDGQYCRAPDVSGTCEATGIDAPISIDGPTSDVDSDGDTILDLMDNCPMRANRDQDNEDQDPFGDVCDPCPTTGGAGNVDADGDGVGAACDPFPGAPGDVITMFAGLNRAPGTPAMVSGTVSYVSGQLLMNAAASPVFVVWPVMPGRTRTVSAQITYASLATAPALAGVVDRFLPSSSTGIACVAGRAASGAVQLLLFDLPASERANTASSVVVGATRIVTQKRTDNTYDCAIPMPLPIERLVSTTPTNETAATPFAGVRASGSASVRVDWVLIVESP